MTDTQEKVMDLPVPNMVCPICKKQSVSRYLPFCSKRCADVDLNRWLSEVYSTPAEEVSEEDLLGINENAATSASPTSASSSSAKDKQ